MGTDLKKKALAYLQIMRFPNIFTAIADVIAGCLIVLGSDIQWTPLLGLCISTSAIYAAGCVLNDLCDRQIDAKERPERPIPSKRVSVKEAFMLTSILFVLGILAALLAGIHSFYTAVVLIFLVVSYDSLSKDIAVVGSLNMGACRACNLFLGMSPALLFETSFMLLPLITLIYVTALTALSKFEVQGGLGRRAIPVMIGWCAVIFLVLWLKIHADLRSGMFVYLALFVFFTGPALLRSILKQQAKYIGLAVKSLVLAIPILDAVYCSGFQGFYYGIPVLLCLAPSLIIARYLYVT
jgi:4-hydroxybenzoate polyprenyltransferase